MAADLAEDLVASGIEVTALAGRRSYLGGGRLPGREMLFTAAMAGMFLGFVLATSAIQTHQKSSTAVAMLEVGEAGRGRTSFHGPGQLDDPGRISYFMSMKSARATVSEKGQVVIPKALRDRLGIRPGQELEFLDERGKLVVRKVTAQDPTDRAYGVLALKRGVDETLRELRGEADAVDHGD